MIEKYLKKLQELQLKTVGTPVSLQIQTRWDKEGSEPWLIITVYHEDWLDADDDADDDDLYLRTSLYEWNGVTPEEAEVRNLRRYNSVEAFVEKLLSI